VCDFLLVMLAVGTRSAELPRVADDEWPLATSTTARSCLPFCGEFKPDGIRSKLNKCDLAFKVEHVAFKVEQ
jgi:hypothetical protein